VFTPFEFPALNFPVFVVLALATWRVSSLFVTEAGPANIFGHLRSAVGVIVDANGRPVATNVVAGVFVCVWCFSVWAGAALAVGYILAPPICLAIAFPFALSAAAVILHETNGGG
jgi:hypothetical protein